MSDEEKQARKTRRERWTKNSIMALVGLIVGCLGVVGVLKGFANVVLEQMPVIQSHDQRLTTLETVNLTNSLTINNRFDREDAQLQMILNILRRRQPTNSPD